MACSGAARLRPNAGFRCGYTRAPPSDGKQKPMPTPYPIRSTASILGRERAIVAMVHLLPLPGSPRAALTPKEIARHAVDEAKLLAAAGFDAILIENMHDAPYLARSVGPEVVAAFTRTACEIRAAVSVPLGVQVLAGANEAALAVALAADCSFIRAEGFVFAAVADEGILAEASAGPLLRYRRALGAAAERIAIFCDIKKKHTANAITSDTSLADHAHAAQFFGADGVIVTGTATGIATPISDLSAARKSCGIPVIAGSGATASSVREALSVADAVIVGSDLKQGGVWSNELDHARVDGFVRAAKG
jgi:membrane complex biogenesis BtpA family protein